MYIDGLINEYTVLNLDNYKIAVSASCREKLYKDIYFSHSVLYYVVSGRAILSTDKSRVNLNRGDIAFIKQHSTVDVAKFHESNGEQFRVILFQIYPDFIGEYLSKNGVVSKTNTRQVDSDRVLFNVSNNILLKSFGSSLIPLFEYSDSINREMLKQKTVEALNYLVEYNRDLSTILFDYTEPKCVDLYDFMLENYISNDSLEQLAQLSGRSLSTFKREFKEIFKTTPHRWILDQKLDKSQEMLRTTTKSPTDLSVILGFNSLSHFSTAFKKRFSITPSAYAEECKA